MARRLGLAWLGGAWCCMGSLPTGLWLMHPTPSILASSRPSPCMNNANGATVAPVHAMRVVRCLKCHDRHPSAFWRKRGRASCARCILAPSVLHSPWLALFCTECEPTRLTLSKRLRRLMLPLPPPPVTRNAVAIFLLRACQPHPSFSSHRPFIILHDSLDGSGSDSIRSRTSVRQ